MKLSNKSKKKHKSLCDGQTCTGILAFFFKQQLADLGGPRALKRVVIHSIFSQSPSQAMAVSDVTHSKIEKDDKKKKKAGAVTLSV